LLRVCVVTKRLIRKKTTRRSRSTQIKESQGGVAKLEDSLSSAQQQLRVARDEINDLKDAVAEKGRLLLNAQNQEKMRLKEASACCGAGAWTAQLADVLCFSDLCSLFACNPAYN